VKKTTTGIANRWSALFCGSWASCSM